MSNELVRTLAEAFTEVGGTLLIIFAIGTWAWWSDRRDQQRNRK